MYNTSWYSNTPSFSPQVWAICVIVFAPCLKGCVFTLLPIATVFHPVTVALCKSQTTNPGRDFLCLADTFRARQLKLLTLAVHSLSLKNVYKLLVCLCVGSVYVRMCVPSARRCSMRKRDDGGNEYYQVTAMCRTAEGNKRSNLLRLCRQRIQSPQLEPEIERELKCAARISSV